MNEDSIPDNVKKMLELESAFLIGSRALGVHDEGSDWDVAVLMEDLEQAHIDTKAKMNLKEYMSAVPRHSAFLIRNLNMDSIIYTNREDLESVKRANSTMLQLPKYLVKSKSLRIALFELCLIHEGFLEVVFGDSEDIV